MQKHAEVHTLHSFCTFVPQEMAVATRCWVQSLAPYHPRTTLAPTQVTSGAGGGSGCQRGARCNCCLETSTWRPVLPAATAHSSSQTRRGNSKWVCWPKREFLTFLSLTFSQLWVLIQSSLFSWHWRRSLFFHGQTLCSVLDQVGPWGCRYLLLLHLQPLVQVSSCMHHFNTEPLGNVKFRIFLVCTAACEKYFSQVVTITG